MRQLKVGWRIPSYAWQDLSYEDAQDLKTYCASIEERGFDSAWVIDHPLVSPTIYSVSWLDPLQILAMASAVTTRISLGTAVLILPNRHPVLLAKEVATLDYLTSGRFILGIGTGWDAREFAAMGVRKSERGRRTDEVLSAVRRLLSEENVTFQGEFYQFEDITILPQPPRRSVPIWVAGGSQVYIVDNPDKEYFPQRVMNRIAHADGWIGRGGGSSAELLKDDWAHLTNHLKKIGRDPSDVMFAHTQWAHVVPTTDRSVAISEQVKAFRRVMDTKRSDADFERSYLLGTPDEIITRIIDAKDSGMEHLIVGPVTNDPEQLRLFAEFILPNIAD